jgi:lysophospholipase L1-like esterase
MLPLGRWCWAALCCLLLSCGSENPMSEGEALAHSATLPDAATSHGEGSLPKIGSPSGPVVLVLGSSASIAPGLPPEAAYPARLQKRWQERGAIVDVLNASIAGELLAGALERLPALLAHPLQQAVLELGQADEAQGTPVTAFAQDAQKLLRAIRTRFPEAKIWLLCSASGTAYREALQAAAEDVPGTLFIDLPSALGMAPQPGDAAWHERLAAELWQQQGG